MKMSLFKTVLFLIVGLVLLIPINDIYIKTNGYRHLNDTDKFMQVENDLEIVNLGSSHGLNGFDYSDTGVKGFNMALAAQGFYYDNRILKQYHTKLGEGAVVLLPISYFSPYQKYEGEKFNKFNMRYYRFLDSKYIRFFRPWDYLRYKEFPILFAGKHIRYFFVDRPSVKSDWENIDYNKFGIDGIEAEGEKRAMHHYNNIIDVGRDNKKIALGELENTVKFCYENGYRPVLVTTPLHKEYKKHFTDEFLKEFTTDIETIQSNYDGLIYLDYSEYMAAETDLFMDSDHLNLKGRKKFTDSIIQDLNDRGLL